MTFMSNNNTQISSSPNKNTKTTNKNKLKAKRKARKRIRQDRKDDIPQCPSMENIVYYDNLIPTEAIRNPSELTLTDNINDNNYYDSDINNDTKEYITRTIAKNQRELDLKQVYGIDSYEYQQDYNELNQPFLTNLNNYCNYNNNNDDNIDENNSTNTKTEVDEEELKRRQLRRKQTKEFFDNVICLTVNAIQQCIILFGKTFKYSLKYPTPFGLAILIFGLYSMTFFLELSVAAFAQWCIQWFWPTTRLCLRATERGLKGVVGFLEEIDDLGQSTYCDMADLWCTEFGLMCQKKCSFLDMALTRSRL